MKNAFFVIEDPSMINQARDFCERMSDYQAQKEKIKQRFKSLGANGYLNSACVEAITFKDESKMKKGMFLEVPREIIGDRLGYDCKAFIPNPAHPEGLELHREMESVNRPMTKITGVRPFVCNDEAIHFSNVMEKDGVFYLVAPKVACTATSGLREVPPPVQENTKNLASVFNKPGMPKPRLN